MLKGGSVWTGICMTWMAVYASRTFVHLLDYQGAISWTPGFSVRVQFGLAIPAQRCS